MVFFSFLSWFRPWWKTSETDYETVLSRLSKDITSVQTRLVRINQRERRASVTLTFYAILLWLLYAVGLWYWSADKRLEMTKSERLKLWSPVILGLFFILSTRFLVRWWYARIAQGEEKHLRSLQRTRRKKIDEIKQATRYDHLRSLLEKYDDTAPPKTPDEANRPKIKARGSSRAAKTGKVAEGDNQTTPRKGRVSETPAGPSLAVNDVAIGRDGKPASEKLAAGSESALLLRRQSQLPRTWLDRVADKILGAEAGGQQVAAEQRYALICRICFTHNGLCPKEEWEEVQYICPRCGTFNSRRPSSTPVSRPWGTSPRSRDSSSLMSPSPSQSSKRGTSFGSSQMREEDEEEDGEEENPLLSREDGDSIKGEIKTHNLRNRKSALQLDGVHGQGEDSIENMEVD
jgi:hypothetical protein